jgi:predicted enzyme related to lactoylglutathione lyase
MYQTVASVAADVPQAAAAGRPGAAALFIEVDDVSDVARRVAGAPVVMPMRETPYGMREVFVREPAGHVVGCAQPI